MCPASAMHIPLVFGHSDWLRIGHKVQGEPVRVNDRNLVMLSKELVKLVQVFSFLLETLA